MALRNPRRSIFIWHDRISSQSNDYTLIAFYFPYIVSFPLDWIQRNESWGQKMCIDSQIMCRTHFEEVKCWQRA